MEREQRQIEQHLNHLYHDIGQLNTSLKQCSQDIDFDSVNSANLPHENLECFQLDEDIDGPETQKFLPQVFMHN